MNFRGALRKIFRAALELAIADKVLDLRADEISELLSGVIHLLFHRGVLRRKSSRGSMSRGSLILQEIRSGRVLSIFESPMRLLN